MTRYFREQLHQGYGQELELVGDMLVDEKTPFQQVQIFDTVRNGRVMALDGAVQISDRDEASYSEMLVHVPAMELGGKALRFLVIGGGDGAVAEECLKYPDAKVEMCEIDGRVVEVCREYFAHVNHGAFADPRFTLHLGDAFAFLQTEAAKGRFDVIVADRPDPTGPAEVLFGDTFYGLVRDALTERGVVVFQTGVPFLQPEELTDTLISLKRTFAKSGVYLTVTPSYIGGYMALTWGAKTTALGTASSEDVARTWNTVGVMADHYTPALHAASFSLPAWVERLSPA